MLLDHFLYNIFDIDFDKETKNTFLNKETDEIDQNKILGHQAHRLNVFYCLLWKYIFKSYPSPLDFKSFVHNLSIDLTKPIALDSKVIELFLNTLLVLKVGLITKINIIEFGKFANEQIKQINNDEFIKQSVINKLEFRYKIHIEDRDNLLFSFFKCIKANKSIMEVNIDNHNPVTTFKVAITVPIINDKPYINSYHMFSHLIYSDIYFLVKLMNHPIIVVDIKNTDYKDYTLAEDIIYNIQKASDKKCIVLSSKELSDRLDIFSYKLTPYYHHLLPCISPLCITICNNQTSFKGLAIQPEHNICIQLGDKVLPTHEYEYEYKYDRIIYKDCKSGYKLFNTTKYWTYHTKFICPTKNKFSINNNLLFIDFIYRYNEKHQESFNKYISISPKQSKNIIILVDTRENELSLISAKSALMNTEGKWHLLIITSSQAQNYYKTNLPCCIIQTHPLIEKRFDIDIYNDILEDINLWSSLKELGYEKALVIQDDGIIIRKGIEKFLEYDYVGAPWADIPDNKYIKDNLSERLVGNGGLSLRSIQTMIDICEKYGDSKLECFYNNINRIPEDVFFVKYLDKVGAKVPKREDATYFSMEQVINVNCLGIHKFWVYHSYKDVRQLFDIFLRL